MTCEAWPVTWTCDVNGISPQALDAAAELASQLLWALSGYRFGICTYVEGIYPAGCDSCVAPYKDLNGEWHNGGVADCCRLLMKHRPVSKVNTVTELGRILDAGDYVMQGGYLKRRFACWPCAWECDDAPIHVDYMAGVPFPIGTEVAMGEVGCEMLAAMQGNVCKLPSRAINVSRQGVTVEMGAIGEFVKAGKIGLPLTDAWLTSVNQGVLQVASKVFSPDLPGAYSIRG